MILDTAVVLADRPPAIPIDRGPRNVPEKRLGQASRRTGHQRKYAPKTRSGCVTCKIRRVKCDEQKPSCRRCTSTGRKCDGYNIPGDPIETTPPDSLAVALVNDVPSTALERRTFDYYRHKTAPSVSGCFPDNVFDNLVLQLSHSEPAVRYAVNALGALHEERILRKSTPRGPLDAALVKTSFPLKQYSKALSEMQALLKSENLSGSLNTVLLCSLLCVHFESLRESFIPALMHAENAIHLLKSNTAFDARKVNPRLVRALMRLDLQGSVYLTSRAPGLAFYTAATDSVLPNSFHDLLHARDLVITYTERLFHFLRTVAEDRKFKGPQEIALDELAVAQDLEQIFVKLNQMLWDFMHKAALTIKSQHGLAMLRNRIKINRILAATCLYSEATIFDRFTEDFDDILTNVLFIMGSDGVDQRILSVSLDEGLLHPLFFLITHCRDGRIRHRALEQMNKLPTQEGMWHVETSTRTAEMCVQYEEALCNTEYPLCSDIPEWRRIHAAGFDGWDALTPEQTVIVHLRTRPNGMDGEWSEIVRHYDRFSKRPPSCNELKTIYESLDGCHGLGHRLGEPSDMTERDVYDDYDEEM